MFLRKTFRGWLLPVLIGLTGCEASEEERPESLEEQSAPLSTISCTESKATGYVQGKSFSITVVKVDGKPVQIDTANAYYVMAQAANKAGVTLKVVSGFRTMAEQQYLYNCYKNCNCNSCNLAAKPGYSNHQSGHALDLNTSSSGVYSWLSKNASKYGFKRTVPSEAWHWEWWGGGPGGGPCGNDKDGDGVADAKDNCPTASNKSQTDTDKDKKGDACDTDDDNDGIADTKDNCPTAKNADQKDTDGDKKGDACDTDDDNDGVADTKDNCPLNSNKDQKDTDKDGKGDACDTDDDGDGVPDEKDNCPKNKNADQKDEDGDGKGDPCDADDDGDGYVDTVDVCPKIADEQADTDGDGAGDACDDDDDNDAIPDASDNCPELPNHEQQDADKDGLGDVCDADKDGDEIFDEDDNCPTVANPEQEDLDEDGIGDACDEDIDGDGVPDETDLCPSEADTDQSDEDHDGKGDVCDDDPPAETEETDPSEEGGAGGVSGNSSGTSGHGGASPKVNVSIESQETEASGGCATSPAPSPLGWGGLGALLGLGALVRRSRPEALRKQSRQGSTKRSRQVLGGGVRLCSHGVVADRQDLQRKIRKLIHSVWDTPQGRLALRQAFYRKYGHANLLHLDPNKEQDPELLEYGFGRSEIDFMRWEMSRGVLNAQGSPWWKGVNGDFLYWSELAGLVFENGLADQEWERPVRHWLDYLQRPSATAWYRAHNTSIIEGYRARVSEAKAEPESERVFVNIVLYRLFFAQALVEDVTPFGGLGKILADPRLPSVQALVHIPDFYPRDYPLTPEEFAAVTGHGGFSLEELAVRVLDWLLLGPHIAELYQASAAWNGIPEVESFQTSGKPTYPHGVEPIPSPNREPPEPVEKKKIVILGGGVSSLAAAWELTSYEGWEKEYEITLYQLGWRCGGKAGGGRGAHGRVEELGLHLLLGFYVNAFPMFQEAYAERTKRGLWPTARYKTLPEAIAPNWGALLVNYDASARVWNNWPMIFPPSPGYPGDGPPLSTWQLLRRGVAILLETILGSPYGEDIGPVVQWLLDHFFPKESAPSAPPSHESAHGLLGEIVGGVRARLATLDEEAQAILSEIEGRAINAVVELDDVLAHLRSLLRWLARRIAAADQAALHLFWLLDFGVAMMIGIVKDVWDPATGKFNYRRINRLDFRAWLRSHGATEGTLFSPIVTFFYTGTFEVLADGKDQGGALAAGTALQFAIPALGYKGSFMFQLRLGTADTLIMPLYQVLAARGVRFEFFSEVKNIPWTGDTTIDRIDLERQVDLVVSQYNPVIDVKGNPAWPSEPLYDQINPEQARRLREERIDLESPWSGWKGTPFSLERGKDFDLILLGIPSKAQATICKEIMAHRPDWRAMVDNIHTAQVMSAQLWLTPTLGELGYEAEAWGMKEGTTAPNVVTYQNPMFSWLDQSYILENEAWPTGASPKVLAMYTGVLPSASEVPPPGPSNYPQEQLSRVKQMTWQWLMDNMGWFFPKASTPAYPKGINLGLLQPVTEGTSSAMGKYDQQWFVAAVAPTNQYVLAVPDTEQYRLQPGSSGFDNVFLVGDWTDYGTNIGYMEGCVVSAKEAVECLRERVLDHLSHRTFWRDTESDWVRQEYKRS